ncbi:MAG: hypothetical protein AB1483_12320 [Candidatus Zixiibacteriota bacterium]
MLSTNQKSILIFFAAVATRLAYHWLTGFTADDAFITFRYAENIAFGKGFVYNEGERVLGTTTPLFTLLLSLLAVLRITPLHASLFISLVSSGLTAAIIYRFALGLRFTRFAEIPAILYILWPRSLAADTCGMETALFTMLVTASFYYQHKRLFFYSVALATLSAVTRPEGLLALALVAAGACLNDRRNRMSYIVVPMALIVPWLLFSKFYFGSVVPHAITAKLALYSRFGSDGYLNSLLQLMGWHNPAGWIVTAAFFVGAWWLNRKQNAGWLEIFWVCGLIVFLTFTKTHIFFWYVVPIYPMYLLFASAAAPLISERFNWSHGRIRLVVPVSSVVIAALLIVAVIPKVEYYRTFQLQMDSVHKQIGLYLYSHADRKNDSAALEDIGYAGYYSKMRILDRDGLVSPQVVPYNRNGNYMQAVLSSGAEWVGAAMGSHISAFVSDSTFLERYRLEKCFSYEDYPNYCIYKRIR